MRCRIVAFLPGALIWLAAGPAWCDAPDGRRAATGATPGEEAERAEAAAFRAFDAFEGKLDLDWKPVRHDPTHVSLTKHPGKLTIVTQRGTIHRDQDQDALSEGTRAKNIFVIANPLPKEPGLVVTTRLDSFKPETHWHQAGLILYDDDDNYLKWTCEFGSATRRVLVLLREENQQSQMTFFPLAADRDRLWLRLTKRGSWYEFASSTDGNDFTVHGELPWGGGLPKRIGLLAKNGGNPEAADIDACFEFFELRSLTSAEKNDPRFVERQKLRGAWKVVSCRFDGKSVEKAPLSRFAFGDTEVTVAEETKSIETEYTLDPAKQPKQLVFSGLAGRSGGAVRAIYSWEDDTLVICFHPRPDAPLPGEFETKEGDGRMLATLKRVGGEE